jgi:hypothetical protein
MSYQYRAAMVVLWAAALLPAAAQLNRFSITRDQVASAINGAGLQVSADQVTLLSNIASATGKPALKVDSIERWGDGKAMVRLECGNPGECLPFIVAVRLDGAVQERQALSARLQPVSLAATPRITEVIRAGSMAVLFLEGPHVHIQLSVVCLENGAMGQSIRVATPDRHLNFVAKVLSDSTVQGRL